MKDYRLNRIHNSSNPHQGSAKRVLCVCSAGLLRSPTTAYTLREHFGYNTRSAGAVEEYALIPVDSVLINWADEIVYMEDAHRAEVEDTFPEAATNKGVVLDIPDRFPYGDATLVDLIVERYSAYLNTEDKNK